MVVVLGLLLALGSLVASQPQGSDLVVRAFIASVVYAAVIPHWVHPIYGRSDPAAEAAFNLIAMGRRLSGGGEGVAQRFTLSPQARTDVAPRSDPAAGDPRILVQQVHR